MGERNRDDVQVALVDVLSELGAPAASAGDDDGLELAFAWEDAERLLDRLAALSPRERALVRAITALRASECGGLTPMSLCSDWQIGPTINRACCGKCPGCQVDSALRPYEGGGGEEDGAGSESEQLRAEVAKLKGALLDMLVQVDAARLAERYGIDLSEAKSLADEPKDGEG